MASNTSSVRPKTKKTAHYVPSRYKQAAEKISSQSNSSKEKTLFHKGSKESQGISSLMVTNTQLHGNSANLKSVNSSCYFGGIKDKESVVAASILDSKRSRALKNKAYCDPISHGLAASTKKDNEKFETFNQERAEAEIDISYALYLQAAFLDSRAEKTLETRLNAALEKIHEVWHVIQIYKQKDTEIQKNLFFFSSLIQKLKHLQRKENILKSTLEILTTLENQYEAIARAVDAVKHKLSVKDVLLPNAGDEMEIIQLLKEINDLLSNFLKDVPNHDEFNLSVCNLKNFVTDGEVISEDIKSSCDQLSEAKDLVLSEASFLLGCELCDPITANT